MIAPASQAGSSLQARNAPRPDMADPAPYPLVSRLVGLEATDDAVKALWDDHRESQFHAVWLRDNCACATCRHPATQERTFLLLDAEQPSLRAATILPGGHLEATFADGHTSSFDAGWLRAKAYDAWALAERDQPPVEWAADMEIPRFPFAEVMMGSEGLARWLKGLLETGIAIVTEAPAESGRLFEIVNRVQNPKETNFGTLFEVFSKPKPNSSAYTSLGLEPHADLVNWACPPDFQALFCIENSTGGGRSIFVNAMTVTEALRLQDPEAFTLLSEVPVEFRFQDETCDLRHLAPVVELDRQGRIRRLRFNNWLRNQTCAPVESMAAWYRAYAKLWSLIRDRRYQLRPRLAPGEMVIFDNVRVLHGREAYDANAGRRNLEGCYLDRDWVTSCLRLTDREAAAL
ncbi:TauD/TfdA family dioxygenase [Limibacillus halophilus]|uniref:Gamma-butyrobetaine dioxygenase n=1 Tax=Limibacillus halophilus TaxID=1579333 RepID=A0A839SYT3_9PROT|nr:TauD/TfdA family dioxygenase [Limibacillus halophilus]MBB3066774.1 gamma-butyrobetaine dioxygenase [Limibacillus halophilus]